MSPINSSLRAHQYRSDIDGLRAFAVLSVVLFHAFPEFITGGFIGVDVFFVISGFLISTIIFEKLEQGSFSFIDFYARRVRRIFPALILVLVTSFILGWCILFVGEYKQLGKHIAGGAGFVANLILWSESGYFDNLADTKPLLHLWSLGIEEQFYVVWPPILWAAWRFRASCLPIIVVIGLASFAFNLYGIRIDPVATFYSPLTRFWELLIGSLLAYVTVFHTRYPRLAVHSIAQANALSWIGCALFIVGLLLINKDSGFPGAWALLPTLGAALMIKAGSRAWFNKVVLGNSVLVWFGLISYPLYLWHWPLLSFARILSSGVPELEVRIGVVTLSILLSWLTYHFVEKPIRFGDGITFRITFFGEWFVSKKAITIALVIGLFLIGLAGYLANYKNVIGPKKSRVSTNLSNFNYDYKAAYRQGRCMLEPDQDFDSFELCENPNHFSNSILLWGDSHAGHLYPGLLKKYGGEYNIIQRTASACPPLLGIEFKNRKHCKTINARVFEDIKNKNYQKIIIAGAWNLYKWDEISSTINELHSIGISDITLIGPVPRWKNGLPRALLMAQQNDPLRLIPYRMHDGLITDFYALDDSMRDFAKNKKIHYFSPRYFLCNTNGCITRTEFDEGDIAAWDEAHLTASGSNFLVQFLELK